MHVFTRVAVTTILLTLPAVGAAVTAGSSSAASDVVGHLDVDDNTAGTNTIAAFDRHADGTLTPLHGSPFTAGGAGTGAGIGSQGALQVTSDGKYLLAVDAGSDQISVLRINSDGELRPVGGGPVSSGGVEPVSIAVHGRLGYVANAGDTGSNSISRYAIAADGSLSLLGSTSLGAASVGAEDARLGPDGGTLWVVDTGADAVSAFAVNGGDPE